MIKEAKIKQFTPLVNSKWKKDWLKEVENCLYTKLWDCKKSKFCNLIPSGRDRAGLSRGILH